jgi:L-seryl-tRNA(Ser) seleniumtransferase
MAGLLNPASHGIQPIETLRQRLDNGADLVVADGAGLIGGPSCGIIVGRQAIVEAAANHFLASLSVVNAATAAALQATLSIYRDPEKGEAAFTIPVWQLLSAPLPNLQQRAERLSALIAATGKVAAAEASQSDRPWLACGGLCLTASTWVIAIQPTGSDHELLSQLQRCERPIAACADGGVVHLDLRSVFPRWDQQLVAAFAGLSS